MKKGLLIDEFIDAVCELAKSNMRVGIWDNRRYELCKKPFEAFTDQDKAYLYKTEKLSRYYVELRAKYRRVIERTIKELIQ